MESIPFGSVLIVGQARPQLMSAIKKVSAIITDEGGILSHSAIISREFGIPAIIGTKIATKVLNTGDKVRIDTDNGIVNILKKVD
jgi:pyruvate,water dikinase